MASPSGLVTLSGEGVPRLSGTPFRTTPSTLRFSVLGGANGNWVKWASGRRRENRCTPNDPYRCP